MAFDGAGRDRRPRRGWSPGGLLAGALLLALTQPSADASGATQDGPAELYAEADRLAGAGDLDQALELLDLGIDETPGQPSWQALFRIRKAEFLKAESLEESLALYDEAEEIVRAHVHEHVYYETLVCHVLGGRGDAFRHWGLLDQAGRWFAREREEVERLRTGGNDVPVERLVANHHGLNLALALNDPLDEELYAAHPLERIKLLLRYGRGLFEAERRDPEREPRAGSVLRDALAELDDGLPAGALPAVERILPELTLVEVALREGDREAANRSLASARALLEGMDGPRPTERAHFLVLEARVGADAAASRKRLAAYCQGQVAHWQRAPSRAGGYGSLQFGYGRLALSELIRLELELERGEDGPRAALAHVLATQATGTLAKAVDAPDVDLALVREELLDEGDGLLLFLPARDRSHLFLVDRQEVVHVLLPPIDRLDAPRTDLVRTLQRPASEVKEGLPRERHVAKQERACAELGRALLPADAVRRLERWDHVFVIGLDLFGELPLEVLPAGEHASLGTWRAVSRLPSAAVGVHLKRAARAAADDGGAVVLVGAARNEAAEAEFGLAPLGVTDADLEALLAPYPEEERRTLLGPRASLAELDRAGLPGARTLQLFAHGVQDRAGERPAAVVLADGLLRADDLEARAAPPLVLLAACRASAGPERRGDAGSSDLAGAFLATGAHAVVASSFRLEVASALRLSEHFHRAFAGGASPAEALRIARSELAGEEGFADPFYHSLWWLVGIGDG
jgi:CHAT domain-containing protein